jgi:hypothetical protein
VLDAVQDGVLDLVKVGDAAVVHEQQPAANAIFQ